MSRWLDREEEKPESSSGLDGLSRTGSEKRPRSETSDEGLKGFGENRRERIRHRDLEYVLRPSALAAMDEIGRFRVIDASDLVTGLYSKEVAEELVDFRALQDQGLVRIVSFRGSKGVEKRAITLTAAGRDLITSRGAELKQVYWSGIVKPAEIEHDILLYRAYVRERGRISHDSGKVSRVVLDYELKRKHFAKVNKPEAREKYREVQAQSARELHLPVIDGHVTFPDFRVEYEDDRGESGRVDVEVATGNYREKHLAAKAAAGFRVYAERGAAGRLSIDGGPRLPGHVFRQERSLVFLL